MRTEDGLWSRSAPWRWLFVLTCLTTAMVILLGPWNKHVLITISRPSYSRAGQAPSTSKSVPTATTAQPLSFHDTTFDIAITQPSVNFPPGTELHIIGVYEGALPNGQKEQPWWVKCREGSQIAIAECHQKYAGQHTEKTISVTVSSSSMPIVLVLMAYDAVKWKIIGASGANIRKIIIAGYYGQDIEGTQATTPVEVYSGQSSPCRICTRQDNYFYAYKEGSPEYAQAINKIKLLTGLSPTSFQGAYRSDRFYISSAVSHVSLGNGAGSSTTESDPITGKYFVDRVSIADLAVPLPEGRWRGITYIKNPSNRGNDELAVLARVENDQLAELIAVRAQYANDGNGFSPHLSCDTLGVYTRKVEMNEAFGTQLCYWVNHDTAPWMQPILALAANRLATLGVAAPQPLINTAFHKADKNSALTAFYFTNPQTKGISTAQTNWNASPWHPNHIKRFPDKAAYVEERLQWADFWFQIFKATRP